MSHEELDLKAVVDQLQAENERLRGNLARVKKVDIRLEIVKRAIDSLASSPHFWIGWIVAVIFTTILHKILGD